MVGSRQALWSMDRCDVGPAEGEAMLRAARAGDRGALEQLVAAHKQPLFVLCFGVLGNTDDAEDAVQEVFLRVLRALPRFRGDASFRTWLFRIAINLCLNWKRDRRPMEPWDEEYAPARGAAASAEAIAVEQLQVAEALRRLSPRHRVVFLLKVLEGWSASEIAAAMGWNLIRVKNELAQARRSLVKWQLENEEGGG